MSSEEESGGAHFGFRRALGSPPLPNHFPDELIQASDNRGPDQAGHEERYQNPYGYRRLQTHDLHTSCRLGSTNQSPFSSLPL